MSSFNKAEARAIYLAKRNRLSANEQQILLQKMLKQFQLLPIASCNIGFTYRAKASQSEVPTQPFENALQQQIPQITWAVPRCINNQQMEAVIINSATTWKINQFGIEEPVNGPIAPVSKIDVALIPLIVFDQKGYRAGYGKGYYDRFLKEDQSTILSVGLSWFDPIEQFMDVHTNDVPLKYCITPQAIYAF